VELRPDYPIRTERLLLRSFASDDVDAVLDMESREDVVRYLLWDVMDRAAAERFVTTRAARTQIDAENRSIYVAATVPPDDRAVGEFMLMVLNEEYLQGEIAWTLHPEVQGRGYATEGAREMLRFAFEELGLHRVIAITDARNVASMRVMERIGMRKEAHHRDSHFLKGAWVSSVVYAILDEEWRRHARTQRGRPESRAGG
jgi:RimJ/RimL family protein N-acetyltransferase